MKKYIVTLCEEEREALQELIAKGQASARKLAHARILLKADSSEGGPGWSDQSIAEALEVSIATIERVRERLVEEGLAAALNRHRSGALRLRKLDGEQEAYLIALTCSQPEEGQQRWTLQLLADKLVELRLESLSPERAKEVDPLMIAQGPLRWPNASLGSLGPAPRRRDRRRAADEEADNIDEQGGDG